MVKYRVYDLECYKMMFYVAFLNSDGSWRTFEISFWKDDRHALVKFLEELRTEGYYLVGFNNLRYDSQVLQFIVENVDKWSDKTGKELALLINRFSTITIEASNAGLRPKYYEGELINKQLDLMKIHHFDNENRLTSLKWLQFMMNWDNLEETPHPFDSLTLSREDLIETQEYCHNDVLSTARFLVYTLGEVNHAFYKGKNKVRDRLTLINQGLLPDEAINYSDSKIGDELNKRSYCKITKKSIADLHTLKRNRKPTKSFTYGDCIPDYVQFQTPEFKAFHEKIKKIKVPLIDVDKTKYLFSYNGTNYTIARGGIHSNEAHRTINIRTGELLRDADIGSQYPNSIKKRKLFPVHLGLAWNTVGSDNITKKDYHKQAAKKTDDEQAKLEHKGLEGMYKLALNSGYFGKTIEKTNWQYGPEVGFYCTIGNQFEILLLIEMLELQGIRCVSANTDGIVCLFTEDKEKVYNETCLEWEKIVGNDVQGKLEYTEFEAMYQESINHYVGVKTDGSLKIKGRFDIEGELCKNNTDKISRIERVALVNYFAYGTPVEKTIKECTDPYLFLIGKKSSRDYRWELVDKNSQITQLHKKVIRFYISLDGQKLVKRKNETSLAKGAEVTQFFSDQLVTIKNDMRGEDIKNWNIDYQYYIDNILEVIKPIESKRKNKKFKEAPKEQTKLF